MQDGENHIYTTYGGEASVAGTYLEPPEGINPDVLLFLGDPSYKTTSGFQRYFFPGSLTLALFGGSLIANRAGGLPFRAGMYRHVLASLLGFTIGEGGYRFQQTWAAERDIQYYHYMITHPEDFPAPERKKYAQVLQPWIPLR